MRKRIFKNSCIILCLILIISSFMPAAFADVESSANSESSAVVNQTCGTIGNAAYADPLTGTVGIDRKADDTVSAQQTVEIKLSGTIDYDASFEGLRQLNNIRTSLGLQPLKMSTELLATANLRAAECAVYYSHTRPDKSDCFTAFPGGVGNYWMGENIAIGYSDITSVTTGWKNSSGHYTNMVNTNFTEVGIGCFTSADGVRTWVQVFEGGRNFTEASKSGKTNVTYSVKIDGDNLAICGTTTTLNLKKGESVEFPLFVRNKGASFVTDTQIIPSYYESTNSNVAVYSSGKIVAKEAGTCTIKLGLSSNYYLSRTVNVTDSVSVTGISLSSSGITMKEGESKTITATVNPSNATDQNVTWQSSNNSVASVTSSGKQVNITGKAAGTAVITAKCDGKTATCQVTVEKKTVDVPVTGVTTNAFSLNMNVGEVKQVAGSTVPPDATSKEITWTVSNPSVAALSETQNGSTWTGGPIKTDKSTGVVYVKALAPGTAVLTATAGGYQKTATITVAGSGGGEEAVTSVSLNRTSVTLTEGESVNLIATLMPSNSTNYNIAWSIQNSASVKMDSESRNSYTLKALKEGTAIFTVNAGMKSASCTINVKKKEEKPKDNPTVMNFYDVGVNDWFYSYVNYVYQKKLMNGVGNNRFAPNTSISRAMIVQILYNMQGGNPSYGSRSPQYADMRTNEWYSQAVKWAASNNIVTGYENGTFRPNTAITREQLVTILYRYAQYKKYNVNARASLRGFFDYGKISSYAVSSFEWAYAAAIISGKTATTLDPQGMATRAETAAIMMRFCRYYNL